MSSSSPIVQTTPRRLRRPPERGCRIRNEKDAGNLREPAFPIGLQKAGKSRVGGMLLLGKFALEMAFNVGMA